MLHRRRHPAGRSGPPRPRLGSGGAAGRSSPGGSAVPGSPRLAPRSSAWRPPGGRGHAGPGCRRGGAARCPHAWHGHAGSSPRALGLGPAGAGQPGRRAAVGRGASSPASFPPSLPFCSVFFFLHLFSSPLCLFLSPPFFLFFLQLRLINGSFIPGNLKALFPAIAWASASVSL